MTTVVPGCPLVITCPADRNEHGSDRRRDTIHATSARDRVRRGPVLRRPPATGRRAPQVALRRRLMPRVQAMWVTSTDEGIEHLVCDIDVGDPDRTGRRLHAVCGRSMLPAALVCEPLPRCADCERHVDRDPLQQSRPHRRLRRLVRLVRRDDHDLSESSRAGPPRRSSSAASSPMPSRDGRHNPRTVAPAPGRRRTL